jgi:hypothetical protein
MCRTTFFTDYFKYNAELCVHVNARQKRASKKILGEITIQ